MVAAQAGEASQVCENSLRGGADLGSRDSRKLLTVDGRDSMKMVRAAATAVDGGIRLRGGGNRRRKEQNHPWPRKGQSIDAGRIESPIVAPNQEVQREFKEAAQLGSAGQQQLIDKRREHQSTSPELSGGDTDAAWEDADVGEESVGGENPTPDQDLD